MKILLSILIVFYSIHALAQKKIIHAGGDINDFVVDNNTLIACTQTGTIETYNLSTYKLVSRISFPKIKDFAGDLIDAEVFKIVKINSAVYAIVHGEGGFNDIYRVTGKKKEKLLTGKQLGSVAMSIGCGYDNKLIISLLSNEIIKYQLKEKKIEYRKQISNYAFSDMTFSEDKKFVFTSDESGEVHKVDLKTGLVVKTYKGQNVDNVISIDYASGIIVCGGKDRRFSVYNTKTGTAFHKTTNSFITAVGINKSGKIASWYDDATNNLIVYNISSKSEIKILSGHESMVTKILFTSDTQLISCGNDQQIIIWNL